MYIFFKTESRSIPTWHYVLSVKKVTHFFGRQKITLYSLELTPTWRIYRPSALKSLRKIRLFITIIYCSDLLCFLIVQFTKKIPLLPFVFISRLWKISHINLQKSFPSDIVINQRGEYRKWIKNPFCLSNPKPFECNTCGAKYNADNNFQSYWKTACLTTISEKMTFFC